VQQCTAVFDRNAIKSRELQFMDMFEASIEEIASHAVSISEYLSIPNTNLKSHFQTNSKIQRFNDFKRGFIEAETMSGPHTHHDLASSDAEYLKIAK
jgi:hypothetical protein